MSLCGLSPESVTVLHCVLHDHGITCQSQYRAWQGPKRVTLCSLQSPDQRGPHRYLLRSPLARQCLTSDLPKLNAQVHLDYTKNNQKCYFWTP
eukprot:5714801-Amphidinium_carterae.1